MRNRTSTARGIPHRPAQEYFLFGPRALRELKSVAPVGRPANPRPGRLHNAGTDWAYWPTRGSADFAAATRHCASSIHDIRARSCSVIPVVTLLAQQAFG